jgi:hypothetical protein
MGIRLLLDTCIYSQPLRRNPDPAVLGWWRKQNEKDFCISAFTVSEVLFGLEIADSERLAALYDGILKNRYPVLAFDADCAAVYARLLADAKRRGRPYPVIDLCIAAVALAKGLVLATLNDADFEGIPGLKIETPEG